MKKVLFIGFTPIQTGLARKFLIFRNLATEIEIVAEQQSSVGVVGYVVNGDDPSSPARLALHLRLNPRPALGVGGIAVQGITAFVGGAFKPATADRLAELLLKAPGASPAQPAPTPTAEPAGNVLAFPGTAAAPEATVLVVDDSEIVQRTMSRKITEYGQRVDVASNGNDALAMLQGNPYKLVFLDVLMPGMDGFEVCKKIKKSAEYKTSAVYMLSSKDGMFDKVRGTLAGCNGYLVKPLEARKLREVLDRHFVRPSQFRDSAFADSRMFSESRIADSRFLPSRPSATEPRAHSPAKPVSMPAVQAQRAQADNEKLLEPYRAEISNAFAVTQPARLEDLPDYKPPGKSRG
jgi:DNA-binding response OmpR family regulator